ncbi:MAG: hypothetical protein PWQ96_375 [Clostridia bacterium]|nr:hypothetical protein [Clostridiales bacterium]MDK2984733.1 hypothetical protein [Clostridia bacterium]
MEELEILQPVTIKVKVTENFKMKLANELENALKKVETELQHLDFKIKRINSELERKHSEVLAKTRQQLEKQKMINIEKTEKLQENLQTIKNLHDGEEVVQDTVQRIVKVKVGDDFKKLQSMEILLEDGKIVEFRNYNESGE